LAALLASGMFLLWRQSRRLPEILNQARTAYSQGDWIRSARLARERLKVAADDPDALRLSARSAARQNHNQQAIAIYSRLDLGMMKPEDYFLLGRSLSRTGQDDLALKALEASRDADPNQFEMLDELAQVYLRKQRPAAATALAKTLVSKPEWEARAYLTLGTACALMHDPAGAARALSRAFELESEAKDSGDRMAEPFRMLLARSLLESGQPAEARRILSSIPATQADQEPAWLLSRSFIQEQAWDQAARALQRARSYRADHPLDPEPALYVGAAGCGSCHTAEADAYGTSRHDATFARVKDDHQLPWPDQPIADPGDSSVLHSFHRGGDDLQVETRVDDRILRAVIKYAFGSLNHFATFVATDELGQDRMLRMSYYDSPRGQGWDISTGLVRQPEHRDEFLGPVMAPFDGLRACLQCHTTNPRAIVSNTGPEAADHAIGCELCHGPGGNHLLAVAAEFPDLAIARPSRRNSGAVNQLCGKCHSQTQPQGFVGGPDDPGWFRFQTARLEQSRCFTASGGALNCLTCHDPHRTAEKTAKPYEAACLSCHSVAAGKTPCPVNPAQGCVECHMPRAWREQTHSTKIDHRIRIISNVSSR
jgi:tetratricopeptide (TPR) repeat protein